MWIYEVSGIAGSKIKQGQDSEETAVSTWLTRLQLCRFRTAPGKLSDWLSLMRGGQEPGWQPQTGPHKLSYFCFYESELRRLKCASEQWQCGTNQVVMKVSASYQSSKFKRRNDEILGAVVEAFSEQLCISAHYANCQGQSPNSKKIKQ